MARYVPDANVCLGWLFDRQAAFEFVSGLTTADEVYAAQILLPECTSALRVAVFDKALTRDEALVMLERLTGFPFRPANSGRQFSRALELAGQSQHRRAYDAQYLAVAELQEAEIVTMDRGMRYAAEAAGVPIRFLE